MSFFDYHDKDDNPQEVEQFTVFDDLSEQDWQVVIASGQATEYAPGDLLLKEGETDDAVYIVIAGQVEVVVTGTFGNDKRVALIDEGSVFGELSFFDSQPRSASVKAVTSGQVLRLSRKGFDKIAAWNPGLAQQFLLDLGSILAFRFRAESPNRV